MNTIGVPSVVRSVIISKEYTLELEDDALKMFLNDRRLKSIGIKTNCKIELTNRILHRKVAPYKIAKYIIICITGPGHSAINQCNRLIESIYPIYSMRKEYSKRAPILCGTQKDSFDSNCDQVDTQNVTQYESYLTSNNEIKKQIFVSNTTESFDGFKPSVDLCCYGGYKVIHPDANYKQANLFRSVEYSSCSFVSSSTEQEKVEENKIQNTPTSQMTNSSTPHANLQHKTFSGKQPPAFNGNIKDFSCYEDSYAKCGEENKFNLNLANSFKLGDILDNIEKEEESEAVYDQYYVEKDMPINIPFVFPVGNTHSSVSQTIIFPCAVTSFDPSFSNIIVNNQRDVNSGVHIQDVSNMDTWDEAIYQKKKVKESLKNHKKSQNSSLDKPSFVDNNLFEYEAKRPHSKLENSWATLMSSCCSKPNRVNTTRIRDSKLKENSSQHILKENSRRQNVLNECENESQSEFVFKLYGKYNNNLFDDSSDSSSSQGSKPMWLNSKYISNYLIEECFVNILDDLLIESTCGLLEELWECLSLTPVILNNDKEQREYFNLSNDCRNNDSCTRIISIRDLKHMVLLQDYLAAKHSSIRSEKERSLSLPNVSVNSSKQEESSQCLQKSISLSISQSKSQVMSNSSVLALGKYQPIGKSRSLESFNQTTIPVFEDIQKISNRNQERKPVKMYDWDHMMKRFKSRSEEEESNYENILNIIQDDLFHSTVDENVLSVTIPVMTESSDFYYSRNEENYNGLDDDASSCVEVDNENLIVCYFQGDDLDCRSQKNSPENFASNQNCNSKMFHNSNSQKVTERVTTGDFSNHFTNYFPKRTMLLSNEFTVEIEGCDPNSNPTVTTNVDLDGTLEAFSYRDPLIRAEEDGMLVEIKVKKNHKTTELKSEAHCPRQVASRGDSVMDMKDSEEPQKDSHIQMTPNSKLLCFPRKKSKKKNKL